MSKKDKLMESYVTGGKGFDTDSETAKQKDNITTDRKRVTFYVNEDDFQKIKFLCFALQSTQSALIDDAIGMLLNKHADSLQNMPKL